MTKPSEGLSEHLTRVLAIDPDARAVEFDGAWTTWGALGDMARSFAAELERSGLPEGAPIGLILRNDPAMVGAAIGVLITRRCVVTLSPHAGGERLATDLRALALPIVAGVPEDLARPEIAEVTAQGGLVIELGAGAIPRIRARPSPGTKSRAELRPGVAIEMLTSGTTGPPKRVPLTFASLEHSLLGAKHYESNDGGELRLREGVAVLNAPLVHVGGIWRVLQCLADGRSFALLPRFDLAGWLDLVRRHRPQTVSLVPAALRTVLDADVDPADLSSVKAVISGTAPLSADEAERFEEKFGIPVLTTYGATEFAGGVAGWNLSDYRKYKASKRGSVGRAHPGCELRVVDAETGAPIASGEQGLLEVRSAQLGKSSGWIRTTDLAVLDADGFLFIRGRADSAIIRGGFKVHPDQVVAALERHPAVKEASVVALPDARLGHVPVAAVMLEPGVAAIDAPDESTLREFVREHLSAYEVPARIRIVAELPRTPSLKVSQPDVLALFD